MGGEGTLVAFFSFLDFQTDVCLEQGSDWLRRMGWHPGQGLGKNGDGIAKPIEPVATQGKQGLGFGAA